MSNDQTAEGAIKRCGQMLWGMPYEHGGRSVRTCPTDATFWNDWRAHKEQMRAAGFSATKGPNNTWLAVQYLNNDGTPSAPQPKPKPAAPTSQPKPQTVLPAFITSKLRDYQVPAATTLARALGTGENALDQSDMGLGKTYNALAVCASLDLMPVIVARQAGFPGWRRVITEHFGIKKFVLTNYEMVRTGRSPIYQIVPPVGKQKKPRGKWILPDRSALLFDECHWMHTAGTKNEMLSLAATEQRIPTLNISATAGNNPMHMRALGYSLGLHRMHDFFKWAMEHGVSKGKFGFEFNCGMKLTELKRYSASAGGWVDIPEGQAELARRRREIMLRIHQRLNQDGRCVRLRKTDIPGFKRAQIIPTLIDFEDATAAIQKLYAEIRERIEEMEAEGKINRLAIAMVERQEIERLKIPGIIDEIKAGIEEGRHVAVFTNFNETVDALCEKFKTGCCIRGGQSEKERAHWMNEFQADKEPIIFCNNQAGGESINLHDKIGNYPRLSLLLPTFWAEAMKQCFGRTERDGGVTEAVIKVLFAVGTIEERQYENFEKKVDNIDTLNDGDLRAGLVGA